MTVIVFFLKNGTFHKFLPSDQVPTDLNLKNRIPNMVTFSYWHRFSHWNFSQLGFSHLGKKLRVKSYRSGGSENDMVTYSYILNPNRMKSEQPNP
jgi:hypothetical protein